MNKNKFEKQGSGMISLNLETTPMNRGFEIPIKDSMDQFSFTLKSKDDPFGNGNNFGGFGDYELSNLAFKGDKSNKNASNSPMTRRMAQKQREMMKESHRTFSPNYFKVDLDKLSHCPC